ncbi:MAG TPA: ABC transporter substrate-binding protein [Methylomirabilota bacterium]|nr:ABC transporter substrate-binding protein [Methylomirabilota bacterium]
MVSPAAQAQQGGKVIRVGVLVEAFRQRLRELGYVEGRHIAIEVRYADDSRYTAAQKPKRYRDLAAELVGLPVDIVVASGTPATRAAKEMTSTVPIVMVGVGDAVAARLVRSLAQPGGTGQSFMGPEMVLKEFDLLAAAFPRAKRIAALFDPAIATRNPAREFVGIRALSAAAHARGVVLQPVEIQRPGDLERPLAPSARHGLTLCSSTWSTLPNCARSSSCRQASSPGDLGLQDGCRRRRACVLRPQTPRALARSGELRRPDLKGAKPGNLPVEQPTTFEFVVNPKTAKTLGVTIPPALLARADEVVQ